MIHLIDVCWILRPESFGGWRCQRSRCAYPYSCYVAIAGGLGESAAASPPDDDSETFFELRVRPVLAGTCVKCHGAKKASGGLRLDSREAMLKGGESGPAVVPGDPRKSLLIKAIEHEDDSLTMPPDNLLPPRIRSDLKSWVAAGATWAKTATGGRTIEGGNTGPSSR